MQFSAQLHNFRKTTLGDNLITLSVDSVFSKTISELIEKDIGTQFTVTLDEEGVVDEKSANKDTRERMWGRMHALINDLSEVLGIEPEKAKHLLKIRLKDSGMINLSTTELDIKGIIKACHILDEMIKNAK